MIMKVSNIDESVARAMWSRYTLRAMCALAFCVSLGTALVSIAKLFVLIALIGELVLDGRKVFRFQWKEAPKVYWSVVLAVAWMFITMFWSEAAISDQWKYFYGHSRLLWLLVFVYLLQTQTRAKLALNWLVFGQLFVVTLSWLMWFGVPVPFTKEPLANAAVFDSYIEQSVMSTLLLTLLWCFKEYWQSIFGKKLYVAIALLVAANVVFVLTGRTGYLVILTFFGVELFRRLPFRHAWVAFVVPVVLAVTFYHVSPRFAARVSESIAHVTAYDGQDAVTSEGQRFDMWYRAVLGIEKKPFLGHGVGSYPRVYTEEGGLIIGGASQPHEQYLLWWVDSGLVGVLLLLSFFVALVYDSRRLVGPASAALVNTTAIAFVMGFLNCPLFGVGMGEYFLIVMAALLLFQKIEECPS